MTLREVIEARPHPMTFVCMNISFAKQVVGMDEIEKAVCEYLKVIPELARTKKRNKHILKARQITMYLGKQLTGLTLREIGNYCGGFDHTTVIHSCNTVERLMHTEEDYKQDVINLLRHFGKSV